MFGLKFYPKPTGDAMCRHDTWIRRARFNLLTFKHLSARNVDLFTIHLSAFTVPTRPVALCIEKAFMVTCFRA
jgi:hypothetical protein